MKAANYIILATIFGRNYHLLAWELSSIVVFGILFLIFSSIDEITNPVTLAGMTTFGIVLLLGGFLHCLYIAMTEKLPAGEKTDEDAADAIAPAIEIDHVTQGDINVPLDGKSICAIRAFKGRGTLVWGARTLDGNSNDWRYINNRRTMIFIEQSVKEAARSYVFAPNVSNTWVSVESMISNFLTELWKQGGLVGSIPADAFSVSVGLGSTMTGQDILNGIMRFRNIC